jgi:hypothetical protein
VLVLQGRLFLSPRIIGFYTNLFGHKTKFFFLWEDIEDIIVVPATLSSMGSPSLFIILRKGRGLDAKHGSKQLDDKGRLKFHFQSFVSFNVAHKYVFLDNKHEFSFFLLSIHWDSYSRSS